MVIKEQTPLTLVEVANLAGDSDKAKTIKSFVKHFSKGKIEKVKEMKEELKKLDLIKLKEEHIVKIIDFMPTDAEDLIKVLADVSLTQDENNKILEVVKKY